MESVRRSRGRQRVVLRLHDSLPGVANVDKIKTNNSTPWWMLLLTMFGGMFLLRTGPSGTPMRDSADTLAKAEARQSADAADQKSSRTNRLRQPLREFLGLKVHESPSTSAFELKVVPGTDANNLSM